MDEVKELKKQVKDLKDLVLKMRCCENCARNTGWDECGLLKVHCLHSESLMCHWKPHPLK